MSFPNPDFSSITDLVTYANTVTGGYLGVLILIATAIILLTQFNMYSTKKSIVITSFFLTIISILMVVIGILSPNISLIIVLIFALSFFLSKGGE